MAMITRREGESEFEFFKRIIRGKLVDKTITEDWEDLSVCETIEDNDTTIET